MSDFDELYGKIGYFFKDESLIRRALTHKSVNISDNYERLEFLGDSIVNFAVSKWLFDKPALSPGEMTEKRKEAVSKAPLAFLSRELGLFALCKRNCAFAEKKESDLYEAVTAAIALDGGMEEAIAFVMRTIPSVPEALFHDHKSKFLEFCAKKKEKREYSFACTEVGGQFKVEVRVDGKVAGVASAPTKTQAEHEACALALRSLKAN